MCLTFSYEDGGLVCDFCDTSLGQDVRRLRCRMSSLVGVLSGLRYHFAGAGVLCTIFRDVDVVTIDAQLATQDSKRLVLTVAEYENLLNQCEGSKHRKETTTDLKAGVFDLES
jgi:hypothetical protein